MYVMNTGTPEAIVLGLLPCQELLAETNALYELETRLATPIEFNGVRTQEVSVF